MTPWLWGFVVGLVVGANVGLLVTALLVAAKDGDRHLDPVTREQVAAEQAFWEHQRRANE